MATCDTLTELKEELILLHNKCHLLECENKLKDNEMHQLKATLAKGGPLTHSPRSTMALDRLPNEFEAVKNELKQTVEQCQKLIGHLEIVTQAKTPEEKKKRDFETQTSVVEELEGHANGFMKTVSELNKRLDIWRESHIFHPQSIQHETFQDVYTQCSNLSAENEKLRREMEEQRRLIETLTSVHMNTKAETQEHIQVLKEQNIVYSEDFINERRDREAAQSKVAQLETEILALKNVIREYETQKMEDIRRRRDEALERYRLEYQHQHPGSGVYQTDDVNVFDEEMGEDVVDSAPNSLHLDQQKMKSKAVDVV